MPKRFRLTRRSTIAMTEDGHRRLRRLCQDTGLEEGELLSFLFENFDGVVAPEGFAHRLRQFTSELEARKR